MASDGISAQGTLVAISKDPNWPDASPQGGVLAWTTIGLLDDITPPDLTRKPIEMTTHNVADDAYVVGIRRKGEMGLKINFLPTEGSQDHLTGLQYKWYNGSRDIYRVTYPDGSAWYFSGFVVGFKPAAPVDNKLSADVTIRPTKGMQWATPAGSFTGP